MKPVLRLIHSTSPDTPGSMSAYAKLVQRALECAGDLPFDVRHCYLFSVRAGRQMWSQHLWRLRHAKPVLKSSPADLYHLLDGSMCGFVPPAFRARAVVTVHDLIPLLQLQGVLPGKPSLPAAWLIRSAVGALSGMAGITTDSQHTLRDVERWTGRSDVTTIPLAIRALTAGNERIETPSRYILHVGNNALYKNRIGVLDVFEQLQNMPDLYLIMAGPEPDKVLRDRARRLGRVSFLVDVSDADLGMLYRKASVFLFPSLYEGFGMPVLEAMAAGCPVVCSDGGSLPEVAGDAALIAPASDVNMLACHCRTILENPDQRAELISRGYRHAAQFNMERFSRELITWYHQAFNRIEGGNEHG